MRGELPQIPKATRQSRMTERRDTSRQHRELNSDKKTIRTEKLVILCLKVLSSKNWVSSEITCRSSWTRKSIRKLSLCQWTPHRPLSPSRAPGCFNSLQSSLWSLSLDVENRTQKGWKVTKQSRQADPEDEHNPSNLLLHWARLYKTCKFSRRTSSQNLKILILTWAGAD